MTSSLAIIGSGPSGYTAAVYAARAGLDPILFTGPELGGQLMQTTYVENYPGFPMGVLGPEMMDLFKAQALRFDVKIVHETISAINYISDPVGRELFKHPTHVGFSLEAKTDTYKTKAVIIATGASPKWLGIPGEKEFSGFGVSACATCDGFFFKGKTVAVIGGGDTAMEEATYLAKICKKVYMVNRSDQYKASKAMLNRARGTANIKMIEFSDTHQIVGDLDSKRVMGVDLVCNSGEQYGEINRVPVDGVFIAIGNKPNSGLVKHLVDLDGSGYIKVIPGNTLTKTPGLFAAGDVADPIYRQAVVAAGMGSMAAIDAERFLAEHEANLKASMMPV